MGERKSTVKKLGALDIMIIIAILVCIVSVVMRVFMTKKSDLGGSVQLDDYVISLEIYDIRGSSAENYLEAGTNFYFEESDELLGTLRSDKSIDPAKKRIELTDGRIIDSENPIKEGDLSRVDVVATFDAKGKYDSNGYFQLGGNKYLGVGKEVKIYSKYLSVAAKITGISLAKQQSALQVQSASDGN